VKQDHAAVQRDRQAVRNQRARLPVDGVDDPGRSRDVAPDQESRPIGLRQTQTEVRSLATRQIGIDVGLGRDPAHQRRPPASQQGRPVELIG
jgi:hypothetical protein